MKKFRIIGMVLVAIIMGVNFTSCKPDDTPEDEPNEDPVEIPAKKLVKLENNVYKLFFKYDDKGRLIECVDSTFYSTRSYTITYTYVWRENAIDISMRDGYNDTHKCTLIFENGLASRINEDSYLYDSIFKYNSSNRLVKCDGRLGAKILEWNDDKLISYQIDGPDIIGHRDYIYDKNSTTKGYNPIIPEETTFDYLFVAHPELAGLTTQNLFDGRIGSNIIYDYELSYSNKYEYEFDEDGYVNKVIVTEVEEGGEEIMSESTYVWE